MLRHLDADKKMDDLEGNDCLFVVDLIREHLINDDNADYTDELEAWLQKIVFQVPSSASASALVECLLDFMNQTSLDYLDICALKHKVEDRDDPKKLLFLALKLELQT